MADNILRSVKKCFALFGGGLQYPALCEKMSCAFRRLLRILRALRRLNDARKEEIFSENKKLNKKINVFNWDIYFLERYEEKKFKREIGKKNSYKNSSMRDYR